MYIAIDDTYGPVDSAPSKYVTGARRTHVAVIFPNDQVDDIRQQVTNCLDFFGEKLSARPEELHFVDIYNRNGVWNDMTNGENLAIISAFANIYNLYNWRVNIQTIDDRTLLDQPALQNFPKIDNLDPKNRDDLSLYLLCLKLRREIQKLDEDTWIFIDEGKKRPNTQFGEVFFSDLNVNVSGTYSSSSSEPLLQIADFLAFSVNRMTHLSLKPTRTDTDQWFMSTIGKMNINCADIPTTSLKPNFTIKDFDELHRVDRVSKGLE
ncbi:hypothetical protein UF64_11840 [Thalassospira sp. HJ]|uniref:DUF3800 domain-containing protein n=1 Tax=Thalassospira sp. HJ TaxID=1616823 RepID=UPI0005CE1BFC|nr:DUF3800 domain-containing protein [Thalassospira sp. HJ]KJE35308.1 hypothetical protein UF64_11840 [Thalassospira sp. HJ]